MWRILLFFMAVTLATLGYSWLADHPGTVDIVWQGQNIHFSVMMLINGFLAALITLMVLWWLMKNILFAPGKMSRAMRVKNREKGLDAVARGLIAVSAGDAALARKLASRAGRKLHADPLSTLLKAQSAQLSGDRNTARRLYEAMLESPETEVAGLRGLYLEARREKEIEAARQFANKAVQRNPKLSWSTQALLEIQSRSGQWAQALDTLELTRKHNKVDKKIAGRQRAVLLTAQALENEQNDMHKALTQALEAHKLAPDLVPAATVAGRILAAQGNVGKASKIIASTWEVSPHPDLALTYAHARPGDSPRDRLMRVSKLAERTPYNMEGPIAVAETAIEGHNWGEARKALKGLLDKRPTARACTLMARIEGGEFGDKGRVREWLARAVRAPRDPAWTADGYIAEHWAPVSPITGRLDAFEWKVPVEQLEHTDELSFEEFIPLKAQEPEAPAPADETPAISGTTTAVTGTIASPVDDQALSSADAQGAPEKTPLASQSQPQETEKDASPAATAEDTAPKSETAAAPPIASPSHTKEGKADPADIEDVEVINAEPIDKPVDFNKSELSKAQSPTTAEATHAKDISHQSDIYIPPRPPDDPGPHGAGSGTGGARKTTRLPQRYRQST